MHYHVQSSINSGKSANILCINSLSIFDVYTNITYFEVTQHKQRQKQPNSGIRNSTFLLILSKQSQPWQINISITEWCFILISVAHLNSYQHQIKSLSKAESCTTRRSEPQFWSRESDRKSQSPPEERASSSQLRTPSSWAIPRKRRDPANTESSSSSPPAAAPSTGCNQAPRTPSLPSISGWRACSAPSGWTANPYPPNCGRPSISASSSRRTTPAARTPPAAHSWGTASVKRRRRRWSRDLRGACSEFGFWNSLFPWFFVFSWRWWRLGVKCGKLKKLVQNNNKIITLVHLYRAMSSISFSIWHFLLHSLDFLTS